MIKQSMDMAKRKANADGRMTFVIARKVEIEDLHYELEWMVITIRGPKDMEMEEYDDTLKMYTELGKILKKEFPKDNNMRKYFNSKVLNHTQVKEAYDKGYGSVDDNNIANKLLEMGILTHVELIEDWESREEEIKTDF
jgi:hypothetical protein